MDKMKDVTTYGNFEPVLDASFLSGQEVDDLIDIGGQISLLHLNKLAFLFLVK